MAKYQRQEFVDGETILRASHLQHIEEGIVQNEKDIENAKAGAYYTPSVSEEGQLTWTGSITSLPSVPPVNIKGKNATINGKNILNLKAGTNVTLDEVGDTITINSTSSGNGSTNDYSALINKPQINGHTLVGNLTSEQLGITGGTSTYESLPDKPQINNVELSGNKTLKELGVQPRKQYGKSVWIGDSIGQGHNNNDYSYINVAKDSGLFESVLKLSQNSACIGSYGTNTEANKKSGYNQIMSNQDAIKSADLLFFEFCFNDLSAYAGDLIQVGKSTDEETANTMCGWAKKCLNQIFKINPAVKMYFLDLAYSESGIQTAINGGIAYYKKLGIGEFPVEKFKKGWYQWRKELIDVFKSYNVPVIYLLEEPSCANPLTAPTLLCEDHLHPSTKGHQRLFETIINFHSVYKDFSKIDYVDINLTSQTTGIANKTSKQIYENYKRGINTIGRLSNGFSAPFMSYKSANNVNLIVPALTEEPSSPTNNVYFLYAELNGSNLKLTPIYPETISKSNIDFIEVQMTSTTEGNSNKTSQDVYQNYQKGILTIGKLNNGMTALFNSYKSPNEINLMVPALTAENGFYMIYAVLKGNKVTLTPISSSTSNIQIANVTMTGSTGTCDISSQKIYEDYQKGIPTYLKIKGTGEFLHCNMCTSENDIKAVNMLYKYPKQSNTIYKIVDNNVQLFTLTPLSGDKAYTIKTATAPPTVDDKTIITFVI